jgi:uncharacterized SAM-binding protein YcdF (DUF218 family)
MSRPDYTAMFKIVLSPLFIGLVALAVGQAVLFRRWRQLTRLERGACLLLAVSTGTLLVASLPIVANLFLFSLERQYEEPSAADLVRANAVVALDGGYVKGKDPSQDRLGEASSSRVFCGVDGFKQSGAKWLIMSGGGRSVELMRDLAIQQGVPPEQVLLEPLSRNTFEHPLEVRKLAQVSEADTLAIATDAFHIPRAMREFKRYFPRAIPVPCDVHASPTVGPRQFLPQVGALGRSTAVLHEYLGVIWYSVRHLAG